MAGYGYVERGVESYLDWGQIGRNFSDMLNKVNQEREAKKKEIDEATRQTMNVVDNPELGVNNTTNQYILDGSSSTSKAILLSEREMKAGRKKPEDHVKFVQNVKDGWASFANVTKSYNQQWKEYQELVAANKSAGAHADDMAKIEKFMDINNSKIMIGVDGTMKVGKMVDGPGGVKVMSSDPNDYDAIVALNNRSLYKRERFDVETSSKTIADRLGKDVRVIFKDKVATISSILQRTDPEDPDKKIYFKYEDLAVKAILNDPFNVQSVLVDGNMVNPKTGNPYEFTWDPNDPGIKNGDKILKKPQSGTGPGYTFELTPEQRKQAEDAVKARVRSEIDYEEKSRQEFAPQAPRGGGDDGSKRTEANAMTNLAKLYYGDETEAYEAAQFLSGFIPNNTLIKKYQDANDKNRWKLRLEYSDGSGKTIDFDRGGKMLTLEQFVKAVSSELGGITDVKTALQRSEYKRGAKFNPTTTEAVREAGASGGGGSLEQAWQKTVQDKFTGWPTSGKGGDWSRYLSSRFSNYFTFGSDEKWFSANEVTIKPKDDNAQSITIPIEVDKDGKPTQETINTIYNTIYNNFPTSKEEEFRKISGYSPSK